MKSAQPNLDFHCFFIFILKEPKEVILEEIWEEEIPMADSKPNVMENGNSPLLQTRQQIGRPLRDYKGAIPISNQLKADIERISSIGQPLTMKCTSELKNIQKCTWTHEVSGTSFDINSPPNGIQAITNDQHICHIQIDSLNQNQLGKWSCKIGKGNKNVFSNH